MTVHRVMGIETEYGISVPGQPGANPMVLSGDVVTAYAASQGIRPARATWDYADEAPLRDARGFDMSRLVADPSQLTDYEGLQGLGEDPTLANVVLTNGARLYVDHAHPEYSSPEVRTPRAAATWDRAGELIMREAVRRLSTVPPGVNLYKNNTDGHGASYGTHENYLVPRSVPFARIISGLIPFFVVRQVMCGSGRVGIGVDSRHTGYQISQRSDFFETEVGLETTLKRPIINTRDEPHALADRYRRLHVILGDANHCDVATVLKLGSTSLVLSLIEADAVGNDLAIRSPVSTLHQVSHDPSLQRTIELQDGRTLRPVELLRIYWERAAAHLAQRYGDNLDADTAEVMQWWDRVLSALEADPMDARRWVDWVAKLSVLEGYRARDALGWGAPELRAVDIQWSDVRPDRGIAHRMVQTGRVEQLIPDAEVAAAVHSAPEDTRAWFRGELLRRFPESVVAASWDSMIVEVPGERELRRIPMLEPLRGTKAGVGALVDASEDIGSLLESLAAHSSSAG